ncbi:hypothetical protein QJS10_CPB21g01058 [Acorus calamus]|uniref:Uncharacterized protein n=1 Tax=Acorus calamus TaxID=4465 RepID=A0AAV9C5P0_ACOCL|nr:hypothetical protein QJS10_CPB21g01058 [Acorus calamus]
MGQLLSSSRPHHDLPNVPSLTSGGLGRPLRLNQPRWGGQRPQPTAMISIKCCFMSHSGKRFGVSQGGS